MINLVSGFESCFVFLKTMRNGFFLKTNIRNMQNTDYENKS